MIEQVRDAKLHWILDQYLALFNVKMLNELLWRWIYLCWSNFVSFAFVDKNDRIIFNLYFKDNFQWAPNIIAQLIIDVMFKKPVFNLQFGPFI